MSYLERMWAHGMLHTAQPHLQQSTCVLSGALLRQSCRVDLLVHSYWRTTLRVLHVQGRRVMVLQVPPPPMAWQLMSPTAKLSITGDGQCLFRSSHPRWWILPITHAVWPSTALLLWLFPWPLQCYHLACVQRSKFCRVDRIFENTSVNKIWFWNYD